MAAWNMESGKPASSNCNRFTSRTVLKTEEDITTFTWNVENFSFFTERQTLYRHSYELPIPAGITSAEFATENSNRLKYLWQLVLWRCVDFDNASSKSVVIVLEGKPHVKRSDSKILEAHGFIKLLDPHFEKQKSHKFKCSSNEDKKFSAQCRILLPSGDDMLFRNDVLTVQCDLYLKYRSFINTITTRLIISGMVKRGCNSQALYEDKENSDVTISCDGAEFRLQKSVLSEASSVFAKMFECDMAESQTGVVNIQDFDSNILKIFFQYVYGFEIEINSNVCIDLYRAADKYDLQKLKKHCTFLLMADLNVDNVWEVAILADAHGDHELFSAAKTFCKINAAKVLSTPLIDFAVNSPDVAKRLLK